MIKGALRKILKGSSKSTKGRPKRAPYTQHKTITIDAWMVVDKKGRLNGSWGFYDDFHIFSSPEQAHWAPYGYYDHEDPKDFRVIPVTITYDLSKAEPARYEPNVR